MPAGLHRFPTYKQATVAAILVLALLAGCGKETSPTEYLKLAQQAYDNGKPGEAILSLKQVLQQEPSNANARKLLAQLYIDDGNGTAAAVELDKAVAGGLSEQELVLQRLASLMLQGKYKEAIALTEQYRDDQQPASVRAVASAIANGTFSIRASVWASNVLPEPVGPSSRMLDFASSTPSSRRLGVLPACTRL